MTGAPYDPSDMLGTVRALPDQIDQVWAAVRGMALPWGVDGPDGIVLTGMGGSAIGGDLVMHLFLDELAVPMAVVRDYGLPAWVGARTLVIASSFSGGTEETLAAFEEAGRRGARRVAVTNGGRLAELARAAGAPVLALPCGGPPRTAVGASMASVLGVLVAAGAIRDPSARLAEATSAMRALVASDAVDERDGGMPHALAARLAGRLPIIYAPSSMAPVAQRWKTQLNENAKCLAGAEVFPELGHNAVVGYEFPAALAQTIHVVMLDGPSVAGRIRRRLAATADLLAERGLPHTRVVAPARELLAEALYLVQYGDLFSVYLAYAHGVDPTPIDAIGRMKAALDSAPK